MKFVPTLRQFAALAVLLTALIGASGSADAQSRAPRGFSNRAVPLRSYPGIGDSRFLPTDVTKRAWVKDPRQALRQMRQAKRDSSKTRVQIGGPNGANVQEQVVDAIPSPASDQLTPFWTEDEQLVYFAGNGGAGSRYQLFRIGSGAINNPAQPGTGVPTALTNEAGADHLFPVVNNAGNRIVFAKSVDGKPVNDATKVWHLFVSNIPASGTLDTSVNGPNNLLSLTEGRTFRGRTIQTVQRACWVGAGEVVFSARLTGETSSHLFSVSLGTRQLLQLTDGPADERNPTISPDGKFLAFDSSAARVDSYRGGSLPRTETSDNDPAISTGINPSGKRNIFVCGTSGQNSRLFSGAYTGAPDLNNVEPAWSSLRDNPFTNGSGDNYYLAFASARKPDTAGGAPTYTESATYDLYFVRASSDRGATLQAEAAPGDTVQEAKRLDTVDPEYAYNDEYPTWSPGLNLHRVAFHSDRTGSLRVNNFGDGFQATAGIHDLWLASTVDVSAPTLVRYNTNSSTGELVHINLGSSYNPDQTVRTREDGLLPGQTVFFTIRAEDREAGIKAAYLQFKNPNSRYQSAAQGGAGIEHKEYWDGFDFFTFNVTDGAFVFTEGTPPTFIDWSDLSVGRFGDAGGLDYNVGNEYEAQVVSLDGSTYFGHIDASIMFRSDGSLVQRVVPNASLDDFFAFSGSFNPPLDGQGGRPNCWLELKPLVDEDGNPVQPADGRGGVLYGAAWRVPTEASDWYIDAILYDKAVDPYDASAQSNWIIYDNIWGFSTALPLNPQAKDILVVSDYTLGQKFFNSRPGQNVGSPTNLPPTFYGAESYYTDRDMTQFPSENVADTRLDSGIARSFFQGLGIYLGGYAPNAPGAAATAPQRRWSAIGPFRVAPAVIPSPNGFRRYGFGFGGLVMNPGTPNTLGVGSYADENIEITPTEVHSNGEQYALPITGRYSLWRVLSRGPVPVDLLQAYQPVVLPAPADVVVGETSRSVNVYDRVVVWASPFSGNLFIGPGTITDLRTQQNLANFVANGGHLFVSGGDIGYALAGNGQANSFFTSVLKAQFVNDRVGLIDSLSIATQNTILTKDPGLAAFNLAFGQTANGTDFAYAPPQTGIPYDHVSGVIGFNHRGDAGLSSQGGLAPLDVITGVAGTQTHFGYPGGSLGMISSGTPQTGAVVFASFGFESIGWDWYTYTPALPAGVTAPTGVQVPPVIANRGRRAEIMANFSLGYRTGTIIGRMIDDQGSPVADALVRAVPSLAAQNQRAVGTALTDASGNFQIVGLPTGVYFLFGYKAGFYSQHTDSVTVLYGGNVSRASLVLKRANPGRLTSIPPASGAANVGGVFALDGTTPIAGVEIQARRLDVTGRTAVLTAVSRDRNTPFPAGSYEFNDLPIGDYTVIANSPTTLDQTGASIPNPNYNAGYGTIQVGLTYAVGGWKLGPNTTVTNNLVRITENETAQVDFLLPGAPQKVTGKVLDNDTGNPIAGATVTATDANNAVVATATTSDTGDYQLQTTGTPAADVLQAGTYTLKAQAVGYGDGQTSISVGGPGGLVVPTFRLTRIPPGSVSGMVSGATGNGGLTGARVRLFRVLAGGVVETTPAFQGVTVPQVTQSGYTYNFRFDSVPVGDYRVTVDKDGLVSDPVYTTISVASGQETRIGIRFRLLPPKIYGDGIQLVSVPFDYTSIVPTLAPSEIFGLSATGDNDGDGVAGTSADAALYNAFQIADWTGTNYKTGPDVPILVGKGYFVRFGAVTSVTRTSSPIAGDTFTINLAAGWNLIGHPFVNKLSPSNPAPDIDLYSSATITDETGASYNVTEAVRRGLIKGVLFSYTGSSNGSQYLQSGTIKPWFGYWLRNSNPSGQPLKLTLKYPESRAVRTGVEPRTLTRAAADAVATRSLTSKGRSDWRLQIAARQGGLLDTDNSIGVAPDAKDGYDSLHDTEKPPMMAQVPSLYVAIEGTNETGRSAPFADMVRTPGGGTKSWNFTVESSREGEITLYWPNVNRLPRGIEPYLVDLATGKRVPMRSGASAYRFTPAGRAAHKFRIEVGPTRTAPLALTNTRVVSTGGRAASAGYRFSFTTTQEAEVIAEVQTVTGRVLRRLQTRSRAAADTSLLWDGKDQAGAVLPAGTYLLSLTARDDTGVTVRQSLPLATVR